MKKIMSDKSFWIILILSIITLIGLTVGVIFLTRQNTKEFYSAGYIINSSATKSDKYYFNDKTTYKENVFNEYVFKDVDDKEVVTDKDNFIHYLDNSLSFMKNGVILDLDNFNENIVPYYNITDKSIIKYNNGGYYIETADKTLVFGNFLGRIADNKYIVVGKDISVKLSGNDDVVKGEYFEILFIEDGIVKIENQEGSYQTISEGTIIYIGDNIKINLGDKSLNYGDEAKLNLTELTIDGNENIDIIPEDGLVDKENESTDNSGSNNDLVTENNPDNDSTDNDESDDTTEDGNEVEEETTTVLKKEVAVNLISASSTVNSISAKFQVIDTMEAIKGNLVLTIVNTTTGETVYTKLLSNTPDEQLVNVTSLDSDCNYVMTIVDENNETSTQYFQKSFRTDSLNLRLRRELVTESTLSYSLDFGINSDIAKADISLYDIDNKSYGRYTVENGTEEVVTFDNLTNNTLYVVKVDRVFVKNVLEERYSSTTSDLTLKNKPVLGNISVKANNDAKVFTLMMDSVTDNDNSIVKYTYEIFEGLTMDNMDTIEPVYSFVRDELNEETLKIGEKNKLKINTNYWFRIVAQYYDNYRYNEVKTGFSESFNVVGVPTISFEKDIIDINRISGTIVINDAGCTVPFKDRSCYDEENNFYVRYTGGKVENQLVDSVVVDSEKQTLYIDVSGLEAGTNYSFDVFATVDLKNDEGKKQNYLLGSFNVKTADIDALKVINWESNDFLEENPISVNAEIISTNQYNESINNLSYITFNLYKGAVKNYIKDVDPIAYVTMSEDVYNKYYNKKFTIDFNMFDYDQSLVSENSTSNLDILRDLSNGELSQYYTIEVTEAWDSGRDNRYEVLDGVYEYKIPTIVLVEDQVTPPSISVKEITNEQIQADKYKDYGAQYIDVLGSDIVRGYEVTAVFEKQKIESYFTGNPITKINFYAHDINGKVIEQKSIDFANAEEYTTYFFLGDGTDYSVVDNDMRRGNVYTFSYDLSINDDNDPNTDDISYPSSKPMSDKLYPYKKIPEIKYYIENSTDNSITYKYQIFDYDNALYDEDDKYYVYYNVNGAGNYKAEYIKDGSANTFTLSNLSNGVIYDFGFYSASIKNYEPTMDNVKSYYFDGYYSLDNELKYDLDYRDDSNYLNIIIEDNKFINRVSSYLVTLTASGVDKKYQKVISKLDKCDGKQCIILNYKDLSVQDGDTKISFKGKDINVSLTAFYDTGYIGFGQKSKLGTYFKDLGLVDEANSSKVGFVYQTTGNSEAGKYFSVRKGNYVLDGSFIGLFDYPRGILGFELVSENDFDVNWYINSSNLIDESNYSFVSYGKISHNNSEVKVDGNLGSVQIIDDSVIYNTPITINPKVLDKVIVSPVFDDTFKFTSIIPNVNSEVVNRLINGAIIDVNLNVDEELLKSDFCATDDSNPDSDVCGNKGKYNIYIDVYQKDICPESGLDGNTECVPGETYNKLVKTVVADTDNLSGIYFDGLLPDNQYSYTISADMNKNGIKVNTLLFSETNGEVYENKFRTLNKNDIFDEVKYSHSSNITEKSYSTRTLEIISSLKTKTNFDLIYKLSNVNGDVFEVTIPNADIKEGNLATYLHDITGDDFVFGSDYHELVITAVTTDLEAPLELYRGKLTYNTSNYGFRKLDSIVNGGKYGYFTIDLEHKEVGVNDIKSIITVKDVDKVIRDGKFYVRLQDTNEDNLLVCKPDAPGYADCLNACDAEFGPDDDEAALNNACRLEVQIGVNAEGKIYGSCTNQDKYTNIASCEVTPSADSYKVDVKFKDLKPDNFYSIFVHADTYSNNYENGKLTDPVGVATVRKNQYTKRELGFSLGSVTPTYSLNSKKLNIAYVDSANLGDTANLTETLLGIEYTITERGGSKLVNGSLGKTMVNSANDRLSFISNDPPTINIDLGDKTLKTNTTYYITISYYYNDNGELKLLDFGDGKTSQIYTIEVS